MTKLGPEKSPDNQEIRIIEVRLYNKEKKFSGAKLFKSQHNYRYVL